MYFLLKKGFQAWWVLIKVMIPVSIVVKLLNDFGVISLIGELMMPFMQLFNLPGETSLVLITTMLVNIYGGMLILFSLWGELTLTEAQIGILGIMMLTAHNLPIETAVAHKAGVAWWKMAVFRIFNALIAGGILVFIFKMTSWNNNQASFLVEMDQSPVGWFAWSINQAQNYLLILVIILALIILIHWLERFGLVLWLQKKASPILRTIGMSEKSAPMTMIGMLLGLAYGGGLIIAEAKKGEIDKKEIFASIALMSLVHALIEDTLLIMAIGAPFWVVAVFRVIYALIVMRLMFWGFLRSKNT